MIELFEECCGNLGGYESDFLYLCSFVSFFNSRLKCPDWTFVGLRNALESPTHHPILREVLRKSLVLAGRSIIGGSEDAGDSRLDRAIARLVDEKEFERSILFSNGIIPDMTQGFLSLSAEMRLRVVRLVLLTAVSSNSLTVSGEEVITDSMIGIDENGWRYFLLKDSNLEVGCWKESSSHGNVELLGTSLDAIAAFASTLRSAVIFPQRSKSECIYCSKRASDNPVVCSACMVGTCHYSCLPSDELNGLPWTCSRFCRQSHLAQYLLNFVEDLEPLQKAAQRKRRRLAGELHALQMGSGSLDQDPSSRRHSRVRTKGTVDYSFRDYDKSISHAIRRSERKPDYTSSEEEPRSRPLTRILSRDERMALRLKHTAQEPFPSS